MLPGHGAAVLRPGVTELNGHLLYALPEGEYAAADAWLERHGITAAITEAAGVWKDNRSGSLDALFDKVESRFVEAWQDDAGLETYGDAVAELLKFREGEGRAARHERGGLECVRQDRLAVCGAGEGPPARRGRGLGLRAGQDPRGGYYRVRGGIPYAIAKSLAAAPFADLLWMETKTADLADAKEFADAVHAVLPGQDAGLQPVPRSTGTPPA